MGFIIIGLIDVQWCVIHFRIINIDEICFQSFRFGPEIAFVASTCLEFLKGEKTKTLVGNGKSG